MQVTLRAVAADDIEAAVGYYRTEAGPETALAFVDSFETAVDHLRRNPLIGSLRFAFDLEIPELRSWRLERFPYVVFYVADDDLIDIWRVLHVRMDVPAHLSGEPPV